jgi:hypothetical protein
MKVKHGWQPMRLADYVRGPGGSVAQNPGNAYVNRYYSAFLYPRPDGSVMISIKPRDGGARHDWREFQWIKNELVGPEREAVELYPAESRLVDTANQFFLLVAPPGVHWPLGFLERSVCEELVTDRNTQRAFPREKRPLDLDTAAELAARSPVQRVAVPPWDAMRESYDNSLAEYREHEARVAAQGVAVAD